MKNEQSPATLRSQWIRIALAVVILVAITSSLALYVSGWSQEAGAPRDMYVKAGQRDESRPDATQETPTPSSTPRIRCTPPACGTGAILYCPDECPGGCGYQCATPTPTPTPGTVIICTPPACGTGAILYCPDECPGGCGYQCATPTPTPTPSQTPFIMCTPPSCEPGEVLYCPDVCPGGCGHQCATPTATLVAFSYMPSIFRQSSQPDLTISHLSITLETGNACYTSTLMGMRIWFQNIGGQDAGPFVIDVNGAQQTVALGLGAGQSDTLWFPGYRRTSTAFIDTTFQVDESNEDNNQFSGPVPIPTLPPMCTWTPTPTPPCARQTEGCNPTP